jgi:DNA (cytosine-5)-methyltransferase 1
MVNSKKNKFKKDLKVVSLFTGCGGMDLGFEGNFDVLKKSINSKIHPEWNLHSTKRGWARLPSTRFKTTFANDIISAARAAWLPYYSKRGNKQCDFHLESIVDLVKREKSGNNNIFPKVDVVTGGFPCQDFSIAGKRNGFKSHKSHNGKSLSQFGNPNEENRGKLYIWMKHAIEIIKPKVFIAENVKGLASLTHEKKIIENDFSKIASGYLVVNAQVLYAPMFGIPQRRERIFFIGFRKNALKAEALLELSKSNYSENFNPYPTPTHGFNDMSVSSLKKLKPYVNVNDCFLNLREPESSSDLSQQSYSKARWYGTHCQGQTEVDLGGVGPTIRAEHHGNIEFRRLSLEHGGKYKHEIDKGLIERRLTVRECARIQSFPDDFEFVRKHSTLGKDYKVSPSEGYKLVGNAVPPLLAFHVAWRLQELWKKIMK